MSGGGRALEFVIPGRIGGKGRHRSFIRNGKIAACTPKRTASDEAVVRQFAHLAMSQQRAVMLAGALRLEVHVFRCFPKSWPHKRCAATLWITGKPDCDNVVKLISDALNGIAFHDDSQIAQLVMSRRYQFDGPDRVKVFISELEHSA